MESNSENSLAEESSDSSKAGTKKQAVVLIHGVGEQIPMQTLRGFANAVWETDKSIHKHPNRPNMWSKPDKISQSLELRRITTGKNKDDKRTDFFEFYWAHMLRDTTFIHLGSWIKVLLLRQPGDVPKPWLPIWILNWLAIIGVSIFWVLKLCSTIADLAVEKYGVCTEWVWFVADLIPEKSGYEQLLGTLGTLAIPVITAFALHWVGDAARYLHVAPSNIGSRREIRRAGITLLQKLHENPSYDRIIVVGHSLGSVIGYDILRGLWPKYNQPTGVNDRPNPTTKSEVLVEIETLSSKYWAWKNKDKYDKTKAKEIEEEWAKISGNFNKSYQDLQEEYFSELQNQGCRWKVTDFVTLGSPLTYGHFLLCRKDYKFEQAVESREFPTCPPVLEEDFNQKSAGFTYLDAKTKNWTPHHAALFAATRWTNIYDPPQFMIRGDIISGSLEEPFGIGIKNIKAKIPTIGRIFTHTKYWNNFKKQKDEPDEHISKLRNALSILNKTQTRNI